MEYIEEVLAKCKKNDKSVGVGTKNKKKKFTNLNKTGIKLSFLFTLF